mmetsp:Transcript_11678/g.26143  ORF Transcript_11678/g.26143 Transcript_11678/m.26143 type:complete len:219 (-) Transcript_11678:153-809(-)
MSEDQCPICLEPLRQVVSATSSSRRSRTTSTCNDVDEEAKNANVAAANASSRIHRNSCGHSVHAHCLHSSIKAGNYVCPICRKPLKSSSEGDGDGGDINGGEGIDERLLKRYTRMLHVAKLPEAAVKQRMMVDGIPPRTIDAFFTGGMSREVAPEGVEDDDDDNPYSLASDSGAVRKYRKMLEMGIPEAAVRNKMSIAGCSTEDIDSFFITFYDGLEG